MDAKTLEGAAGGMKGGMGTVLNAFSQLRSEDARSKTPDKSSITAADNTSVPYVIPAAEEQALLDQLRQTAKKAKNDLVANAEDFWLLACLRARKGDVERALALATNYLKWRIDVGYHEKTAVQLLPAIRAALTRGLVLIAGNESRDGRPVLMIRYRHFDPRKFSALDVALTIGLMIEYMLREYPKAQTHGIVIVEDAAGFSISNFDPRLMHFLSNAFTKVMPTRVAALHVTNPGWVVKTIFGLISGFLSRKLQARVRLCSAGCAGRFAEFFEPHQIPTYLNLGGTMEWTDVEQKALVARIEEKCLTWPAASSHPSAQ